MPRYIYTPYVLGECEQVELSVRETIYANEAGEFSRDPGYLRGRGREVANEANATVSLPEGIRWDSTDEADLARLYEHYRSLPKERKRELATVLESMFPETFEALIEYINATGEKALAMSEYQEFARDLGVDLDEW
ncbi:hypothetical protein [Pseudonocardia kunmingensis]|uniref:Uncharacterized protein n=1 Tax=Pseudonocardia kunmingensis TaxID=630975 RepID=A0A543DAY5_9PSEU|nr:hypothetical protein [Pseudonocardia kunmingensis]TQM06445.1 hypothetical protein FB558_6701 [Pseudonocardia kunmingensis]